MRRALKPGDVVVVKVGSSSLTDAAGGLDHSRLQTIVDQIAHSWASGFPTVLVTSGAVAAGMPALSLSERPKDVAGLQVAASVGMGKLMAAYSAAFSRHERVVGQVLLTKDALSDRRQYLNARQALERMLAGGVVPIVNENDTVVVDELSWGDNDRLAALVGHLVGAGLLLLLSDTAGLFSEDPRLTDDAELLSAVRHSDEALDQLAHGTSGPLGSGGVGTKVVASRMAAWSGIPTVIASASAGAVVADAVSGADVGTWVEPHESGLNARKLWIAFGQPPEGTVVVDAGAVAALRERGGSLLAVGVVRVEGAFAAGDAVEVCDADGGLVGKGLVRVSAADITAGAETSGPAIHRDDLVVF